MMTREEKLYSMTMVNLLEVANKLGVKIDKKGAKSKAVAKILAAENAQNEIKNPDEIPTDEYVAEVMEQKKELGIECPPIESVEIVSEDKCADGTDYSEIGKEIAEEAKQKAKAVKKSKVKVDGRKMVADILDKNKKNYKIIGKRLRLLDSADKCFAYGLFNNSSLRLYIKDSCDTYFQIEDIATDNTYEPEKLSYNKTIIVDYSNLEVLVKLATDRKEVG